MSNASVRAKPNRAVRWASFSALAVVVACAADRREFGDYDFESTSPLPGATCETPNDGCPCETPGAVAECGRVERRDGDYVACSMGKRTCNAGHRWGTCIGEVEVRKQSVVAGLHAAALAGTAAPCAGNPCDPYCNTYDDTPTGIVVPPGLQVISGGLTLAPTGTFSLASCTSLVVTPAAPTLTITSISPTVSPDTVSFSAALAPAGCYPGTIVPIWTVNDSRASSVTITGSTTNATSTLRVVSPIAGPVTVKAYLGSLVGTATAQINVNVVDSSALPSYAGVFPVATGTADATFSLLYPYADTVFPLGLPPPIPQWQATPAASAVKVALSYVNGATSFKWSAIAPENATITTVPGVTLPAAPRYPNIPTAAWFAFEQSAKGQNAQITLQRFAGAPATGVRYAELPTTIRFANGQLKGNIYYQSYGTQLARNFLGGAIDSTSGQKVFPGGAMGAATLAIAPGATTPTVIAGSTGGAPADGSGTYCRVCHTASADGSVLITQKFGGGNLVSQRYTNLSGAVSVVDMSPGDGRFAWPALFPTGGTTSGFLFGNSGVTAVYNTGPAPGGLDASNSSLTSALYSVATAGLGGGISATYRTTGPTPKTINIPSSGWGLQAAVPVFSSTGTKVAMQFHNGKVCATDTSTNCDSEELKSGDKRSLAIMDFDDSLKRFTNFEVRVTEPNTPCNTTFHPTQPCFTVWPTFIPNNSGIVYEREIFHNGNVGAPSATLSDFGGTRSGCDLNSPNLCANDGTKAELWWVNLSGAAVPTRLNQANGRRADNTSYLPVGSDPATFCRVSGFACAANGDCCSGTCSNGRCAATKRTAGSACTAASQCESNQCVAGASGNVCGCLRNADCLGGAACNTSTFKCPSDAYYTPPAQTYRPGHNATVEPVLNYEPTMNPTPTYDAAGTAPEYYWTLFTSRRMFGNIATVDPWWSDPRHQDISQTVTPKKLWVAAIRANAPAGTDPSYPAFYLPGQEWVSGNSKAYWVQNACKVGSVVRSAATECEVSADCCSGSVCQLETPVTNPAKRYCVPTAACVGLGGSCSAQSDCCAGRLCSGGTCQDPPPLPAYSGSQTFTRDFPNPCIPGERPEWLFFDYQAAIPNGTKIEFRARTAEQLASLPTATPLVNIGTANPPSTTGWTSFPSTLQSLFKAAGSESKPALRVEMQLFASADTVYAPTLTNWRVGVDCLPRE